jgi:hypothetical protein
VTRARAEEVIRGILHGLSVRVVWTVEGEVGDVLVAGRSALPETMAVLARQGVPLAPWDPSPGRIGTQLAGERPTRVAARRGARRMELRLLVVDGQAAWIACQAGAS